MTLSRNVLPPSRLSVESRSSPWFGPSPALAPSAGAGVQGASTPDIGILLAAHLNNLMAISRAAVVVGEGHVGEDL
jgi:hypothetical protein